MIQYDGTPFQYNPAVTNINIDAQLAGILSNFNEDYIMDVISNSLDTRFRLYELPAPNIVYGYEITFKQLTEGFTAQQVQIISRRNETYQRIIRLICDYYNFEFKDIEDTDYYSIAYWLYEFGISNFTKNLISFYVSYLIRERSSICQAMDLTQIRRENDPIYAYSKKLFMDPKLAMIHANINYVIDNMSTFDISLHDILEYIYSYSAPTLPDYFTSLVKDTGNFFKDFYEPYVLNSDFTADLLVYIKLELQKIGATILPE